MIFFVSYCILSRNGTIKPEIYNRMKHEKLFVTKSFLPPKEDYLAYLDRIWDSGQMTNQGGLTVELENKLSELFQTDFLLVCNGTVALQLLLKLSGVEGGEVITTPFSYVATTSSILWEHSKPVYADIERERFCIDPEQVEACFTPETKAILATHVFGYPCDIEKLSMIAAEHKVPLIFDAAHAFGCVWQGKPLAYWGDGSACSFHATKLFHTAEGGGCIIHDRESKEKLDFMRRFGHCKDDHMFLGINAKISELHAAMGLCNLKYTGEIVKKRREISDIYDSLLPGFLYHPSIPEGLEYNYAYYPVLFESEEQLLYYFDKLEKRNIFPRRYFYPSLNTLPYLSVRQECPVSEDISSRIACLPLSAEMSRHEVEKIMKILNQE